MRGSLTTGKYVYAATDFDANGTIERRSVTEPPISGTSPHVLRGQPLIPRNKDYINPNSVSSRTNVVAIVWRLCLSPQQNSKVSPPHVDSP